MTDINEENFNIGDEENIEEDSEIEFLPDEEGNSTIDAVAKIKKLKEQLKASEKERLEYLANWQRERADFQNYKKDESVKSARLMSFAKEKMAEDLLPVLDSYDMAFSNKEAWEKVDKNWRMGVEYIHQQLLGVLSDQGVSEIPTKEGDTFDPNLHQPIESIETNDESKDNTIERVISKGYKTSDKIIRPSRANVFSYKAE